MIAIIIVEHAIKYWIIIDAKIFAINYYLYNK